MIEALLVVLPLMLSPGPANLISFALGTRFGFSQILPFLFGVSLVYIFVAVTLGVITIQVTAHYSSITQLIKLCGGIFIIYLGIQLLRHNNRNTPTKRHSVWNGIVLQILNPKYPPVVLTVFANSQAHNALVTAGILSIVGIAGLIIYASVGTLIHQQLNMESHFKTLDIVFGVLLCIVGMWLAIEPVGVYLFYNAT